MGGMHLHPLNYALGLAKAAEESGVKIFEDSRVTIYSNGSHALLRRTKERSKSIMLFWLVMAIWIT